MELNYLLYTHQTYSDMWNCHLGRLKNFFPELKKVYIASNDFNNHTFDYPFACELIKYNDSLLYNKRLLEILKKINDEYIIFCHEDMILYDHVKVNFIIENLNVLKKNPKYSFVRFQKSGINTISNENYMSPGLFEVTNNDYVLSITPSIWNVKDLKNICEKTQPLNIWDFEIYGTNFCISNDILGLYSYHKTKQTGGHFESFEFPNICTAVFKGKWNFEYKDEINKMAKEYNINTNIRGWNG